MNANERELLLRDEVYQIIGSAIEVSNILGHGLLEKPYERALAIEFGLRSIPFTAQRSIDVIYKGTVIGHYVPDLIAFGQVVVEIKCVDAITHVERAQLLNYLRLSRMQVGLILNFKHPKLDWERLALSQ